jgi:hypothetical protein
VVAEPWIIGKNCFPDATPHPDDMEQALQDLADDMQRALDDAAREYTWDLVALDVLKQRGYTPEMLANVRGTFDEETGILNVHADLICAAPRMYIDINLSPIGGS